ncbi:MAG TPA: hypothetical protein VFA44_03360 [Gaiellaceae bacterium]|nr:hypothetical protein [Gaiellaceae bacterium]
MIYCVVPPELKEELYDRLVEHYKDNPDVTVIIDRRRGPDRRRSPQARPDERRVVRDRRRARAPGTFPSIEVPAGG